MTTANLSRMSSELIHLTNTKQLFRKDEKIQNSVSAQFSNFQVVVVFYHTFSYTTFHVPVYSVLFPVIFLLSFPCLKFIASIKFLISSNCLNPTKNCQVKPLKMGLQDIRKTQLQYLFLSCNNNISQDEPTFCHYNTLHLSAVGIQKSEVQLIAKYSPFWHADFVCKLLESLVILFFLFFIFI